MRVTKADILNHAATFGAVTFMGFFMAFLALNLLLGCETWDQSLWTERNSCVTPAMIWEQITNQLRP